MGNSRPGGKIWRKNYPEERIWGKDGDKPLYYYHSAPLSYFLTDSVMDSVKKV